MKIAVIGAGLAGLNAAYVLQESGAEVTVYETASVVGACASGNALGMVNPRISAEYTPIAAFYIHSFLQAIDLYQTIENCDWTQCGALHLITDDKRATRYEKTALNWASHLENLSLIDHEKASEFAGIALPYNALHIPQSGYVSPIKLCKELSNKLAIRYDTEFNLESQSFDKIIIACAMGSSTYIDLPIKPVRGQITHIKTNNQLSNLKCNLHYGGYISAAHNGEHAVGATFQRWINHTDIINDDDIYNLNKLQANLPQLNSPFTITNHRASMRTTSPDHAPIIGHVRDNIYASTAHGSHGLVTAIGGAHMLRNMIIKNPVQYSAETVNALSPQRF